MNWLDIVVIVMVALSLVNGFRMGLIKTVFLLVGTILALILAAQISGPLADALTDTVGSASIAATVAYAIVLVVVMAVAQIAGTIVRKVVGLLLLGWADRLAGMVLGLLAGLLMGGAIIAILARLAFLVPDGAGGAAAVIESREGLERALVGSALVPVYLRVWKALPASALGMVPGSFSDALDELRRRIDAHGGQSALPWAGENA